MFVGFEKDIDGDDDDSLRYGGLETIVINNKGLSNIWIQGLVIEMHIYFKLEKKLILPESFAIANSR